MRIYNRLRLKFALWLLSGLPENVCLGSHTGAYACKQGWHAGRVDSRGVLQGYDIERVFEASAKHGDGTGPRA